MDSVDQGAGPGGLRAAARAYKRELRLCMLRQAGVRASLEGTDAPIPFAGRVVGVGFGAKITRRRCLASCLSVRVYVREKLPQAELAPGEAVPTNINGLPTDVIEAGVITALKRPTACGVSVGHYLVPAGTLGCLAKRDDGKPDEIYILSNNHVLANTNNAERGDPILEPGLTDGGNPAHPIAHLTEFVPLRFDGSANRVDLAIARLARAAEVSPRIAGIGLVRNPPMAPCLGQAVRKRGRTTLETAGEIVDLSADIEVRYGLRTAFFEDQLAINDGTVPFSAAGDSGALILDAAESRPVGLLFAGGGTTTFANPIDLALEKLKIRIC